MLEKNALISLKKISCKVGHRYLVRDICWEIYPGEHWVVFGMNASGKTTLLSIIAGFQHYTSGEIMVFGHPECEAAVLEKRRRVGFVSSSFFDKQYSKENTLDIVLSGKQGHLVRDYSIALQDILLAKDLLDELGMKDKYNRAFDTLSKGERQNVLIARALIGRPDILILDEPCTGLDVYHREYLFRTIEDLARDKKMAIIYVTHYTEEILPLFQKALFLKNGRVFANGNTAELMNSATLSRFVDRNVQTWQDERRQYHMEVEASSQIVNLLRRD